jgi:hypothetical protein
VLIERAYQVCEQMGLAVWTEDEAGPYGTHPYETVSWQPQGSAALYSLDFFTSSTGTIDAALIYDPGVTARGETIGLLPNVSQFLSLTGSAFTFI